MTYRSVSLLASAALVLLAYGCSSSSNGNGTTGGGGNVCGCAVSNNGVSATLDCGSSQCVNGTNYTCGASAALVTGESCDTTTGGDDGGQGDDDSGTGDHDASQGDDDAGSGDDANADAEGSGDNDGGAGDDASQGGDDAGQGGSETCSEVSCQTNEDCQTVSAGMVCLQLTSVTTSYACFFASPIDTCGDPQAIATVITCGGSTQYACIPGSCSQISETPAGNQQETSDGDCGE